MARQCRCGSQKPRDARRRRCWSSRTMHGKPSRFQDELRFFCGPELYIEAFPDWETLPYDLFSPHPDIVSQRLRMLSVLPRLTKGVVIVDLETLLQRLAPQTYIDAHAFDLSVGETIDLEQFRARLAGAGYVASSQVMAPGEFAVRGSLIDLFPMGSQTPYRIDLFDRDVESIRIFDPESQRSGDKVKALRLLPAREFPLTAEGIQAFKRRFRNRFPGDLTRMSVYQEIAEGAPPAGIEYYLPLFFDASATLFDYLPPNTLVRSRFRSCRTRDASVQRHSNCATNNAATTARVRS